jgi:hypothetical protein
MRRFHSAATLAVLFATATACPAKPHHTRLPEGTAVMLVGRISSEPGTGEEKMQVSLGPRQVAYSLHLSRASVLSGPNGRLISEDDLHHGQWIRAEGRIMTRHAPDHGQPHPPHHHPQADQPGRHAVQPARLR